MPGRAKRWWETFRAWPTWAQAVSWVFLVIVVIAALAPADEAADEVVSEPTTTTEASTTTTTEIPATTAPAPPPDSADDGFLVSCSPAPTAVVAAVAEGLKAAGAGSLVDGQIGRVTGSAGAYLVAAIEAPGVDRAQAVWWLGGDLEGASPGPVIAIDGFAREFSDWGAAAQPGSPAEETRMRREPEARAVREWCGRQ